MSDQDLREQVARLLNEAGWTCYGGAHEPGQLETCEDCRKVCLPIADALLPLFVSRERAAAEKGWDEAATDVRVEQIHADMALIDAISPPRYIFTETQREGFRAAQSAAIRAVRAQLPVGNTPPSDYVEVIAQLEGEEA